MKGDLHMGKLVIRQDGQMYYIFTPQGIQIAQIWLGCDGQYALDVQCINAIGRALAKRWGLLDK